MLIHPRLSADGAPSDDIRKRISALVEQAKADPKSQTPLLHLAKAYGDVWVKNNDPNVMLRAMQCTERAIELVTVPGDWVVDPFGGTGTTLRVCRAIGRDCTLLEANPAYCEEIQAEHGMVPQEMGKYARWDLTSD